MRLKRRFLFAVVFLATVPPIEAQSKDTPPLPAGHRDDAAPKSGFRGRAPDADDDEAKARRLPKNVTNPGVITSHQVITPAGAQAVLREGDLAYSVLFGDRNTLWALTSGELISLNWRSNRVLKEEAITHAGGIHGIAFDSARKRIALTRVDYSQEKGFSVSAGPVRLAISDSDGNLHDLKEPLGTSAVGTPVWYGDNVLVPLLFDNKLAIVHSADSQITKVSVGIAPIAVAVADHFAYVANFGGRLPEANESTAPTGELATADHVRIDAFGVAQKGSITVVDLETKKVVDDLDVGRHPSALAIDKFHNRLFVANTNDDTITIIDLRDLRNRRTVTVNPIGGSLGAGDNGYGVAPTAFAFDNETQRLYIALGGLNAIEVYDAARFQSIGLIPTGWYPCGVDLDPSSGQLAVANLFGVGSGDLTKDFISRAAFSPTTLREWGADLPSATTYKMVYAIRGTVQVLPLPNDAQLAALTRAARENSHLSIPVLPPPQKGRAAPLPVPLRSEDPSLVSHVVYIVKENQSYDTLFGDLKGGNGEADLLMYDDTVIPNHRKLARDYVLFDNFYANGTMSQDGHQWLTQANETNYTLLPADVGRSYPFDGSDPLAYSAHGFIWDAARARGRTTAVFGEFAPQDIAEHPTRIELLKRWQEGEHFHGLWNTHSPIPPLDRVLVRDYPAFNINVPDVIRAQRFKDQLDLYERSKSMPNLTIVQLPSDHTFGIAPGLSSPKAMMAENDLALGMIVEALTKSSFWPHMAIYVVEDDAQNGVDHVDGHRTVALLISPYTRRNSVDSMFYSFPSILKTIELQLGLKPLSLFDSIANDMRASFVNEPDLTPYSMITPEQNLFELSAEAAELSGAQRDAAIASASANWKAPDEISARWISEVLWHDARGWSTPFPKIAEAVFVPQVFPGKEDDEDEEDNKNH